MLVEQSERIRDIDVAYAKHGSGRAVVLVHGLAEDHHSFAAVQAALPDYATYAYSFRGHGKTSVGDAEGSLQQLGEDLIAFLENLDEPATCVGYSLGGAIVLWAASRRPDLISSAIVVGTSSVVGRVAVDFFRERVAMLQSDSGEFPEALRADTATQLLGGGHDLDAVTARRLSAVGDGRGYINAAKAMIGLHKVPLNPELAKIRGRVDVIGASDDVFCPRKAADIMMAELGNCEYHEIEQAGHLVSVDQPDAYAAAIRRILQRSLS